MRTNLRIALKRLVRRLRDGGRCRVLILPGDPSDIFGSRGDQAMIETIREEFHARARVIKIGIVTSTDAASAAAIAAGYVAEQVWPPNFDRVRSLIVEYDHLTLVGADVMDGYYCPEFTKNFWRFGEVSQMMGTKTSIMGCSFNESPAPDVIDFVRSLKSEFCLNIRDPVSHRRFSSLFERKARLVSDIAFLLKPASHPSQEIKILIEWIQSSQRSGSLAIGLNINTHLFRHCSQTTIQSSLKAVADAVRNICKSHNAVMVLLPHDMRPASKDEECLSQIDQLLAPELGERIQILRGEPTAAELKLVVGSLDVLVTGRMHLGIAALSQGVPMAAITYQGKFIGLLEHFGLPEWLLISPEDTADSQKVEDLLHRLVRERIELAQTIRTKLPHVIELAGKNFD